MKSNKFDAFMELVQKEARKKNSRFFISSGEGHDLITESAPLYYKSGFLHVLGSHLDLIISREDIHVGEDFMLSSIVDQDANMR